MGERAEHGQDGHNPRIPEPKYRCPEALAHVGQDHLLQGGHVRRLRRALAQRGQALSDTQAQFRVLTAALRARDRP